MFCSPPRTWLLSSSSSFLGFSKFLHLIASIFVGCSATLFSPVFINWEQHVLADVRIQLPMYDLIRGSCRAQCFKRMCALSLFSKYGVLWRFFQLHLEANLFLPRLFSKQKLSAKNSTLRSFLDTFSPNGLK